MNGGENIKAIYGKRASAIPIRLIKVATCLF